MSNARAAAPTRQQLDELDALLQRMLALPVSQGDPGLPEPEAREARPEAPAREARLPRKAARPAPAAAVAEGPPHAGRLAPPPARAEDRATRRAYPASYMVVESSTPPFMGEDGEAGPPPEEPAPEPFGPALRVDPPVPGGAHDLVQDGHDREEAGRAPGESGEWVPLRSSWQPSAQTWKPLAERWHQARVDPPQEVEGGISPPHPSCEERPTPPPPPAARPEPPCIPPPPPAPAPVTEVAWRTPAGLPGVPDLPAGPPMPPRPVVPPLPVTPAARRYSWPALPVVWFNRGFDACLWPLGPLGWWLRRPSGRNLLGAAGLLGLAAAAAVALADGVGWTW